MLLPIHQKHQVTMPHAPPHCLQDPEDVEEAEQQAKLFTMVEPHCCKRMGRVAHAHAPQGPRKELLLPVELSAQQAECYRTLLARYYEILADPKVPRHSGHRATQLKHICNELRRVCNHPFLLPEFEPEKDGLAGRTSESGAGAGEDLGMSGASTGGLARTSSEALQAGATGATSLSGASLEQCIAHSGKLQVLDRILSLLRAKGQRVLLLSQSSRILDILEGYATARLGAAHVARIDSTTPSAKRHAQVGGSVWLDSCGSVLLSSCAWRP